MVEDSKSSAEMPRISERQCRADAGFYLRALSYLKYMTLGRCHLSIFCSRGTPDFRCDELKSCKPTNPESIPGFKKNGTQSSEFRSATFRSVILNLVCALHRKSVFRTFRVRFFIFVYQSILGDIQLWVGPRKEHLLSLWDLTRQKTVDCRRLSEMPACDLVWHGHASTSITKPVSNLISLNAFIDEFQRVNSPTKSSTYCSQLFIKISS